MKSKLIFLIIMQVFLSILFFLDIRLFETILFHAAWYLPLSGAYYINKLENKNIIYAVYIPVHLFVFGFFVNSCSHYEDVKSKMPFGPYSMYEWSDVDPVTRITIHAEVRKTGEIFTFNITDEKIIEEFAGNMTSTLVRGASSLYDCSYIITFYGKKKISSVEYRKTFDVPEGVGDRKYFSSEKTDRTYKYHIPNEIFYDYEYQSQSVFSGCQCIRTFDADNYIAEDLVPPLLRYIDPHLRKKNTEKSNVINI